MKPFDANGAFQAGADRRTLGRLAVRGAGATVFSGGAGLAIQVIATMILARLVTPADFGVVTMVTTFSLLFLNFGLNGFTEAVVQRASVRRVSKPEYPVFLGENPDESTSRWRQTIQRTGDKRILRIASWGRILLGLQSPSA